MDVEGYKPKLNLPPRYEKQLRNITSHCLKDDFLLLVCIKIKGHSQLVAFVHDDYLELEQIQMQISYMRKGRICFK